MIKMQVAEQPTTLLEVDPHLMNDFITDIDIMADRVANIAKSKGWDEERTFGDLIALMHSELSESLEEFRNGHPFDEIYFNEDAPNKPEGIGIELADCVIRIMHFCHLHGVDLAYCINLKKNYNLTRPHRHGGKKI